MRCCCTKLPSHREDIIFISSPIFTFLITFHRIRWVKVRTWYLLRCARISLIFQSSHIHKRLLINSENFQMGGNHEAFRFTLGIAGPHNVGLVYFELHTGGDLWNSEVRVEHHLDGQLETRKSHYANSVFLLWCKFLYVIMYIENWPGIEIVRDLCATLPDTELLWWTGATK